jgi:thiol-disulfide isomerase/thioredoxin
MAPPFDNADVPNFRLFLARKLHPRHVVNKSIVTLILLGVALGARADVVQLTTGKTVSGRVVAYGSDGFFVQPTNSPPVKVPADMVSSIDFSKGAVLASVTTDGQEPLHGKIWLYAHGALNFDSDNGETTKIPLTKISRVSFSADPIPERPAPPPRPKPESKPFVSPYANAGAKIEVISHGEKVDIQEHCERGKITIVDFYADWCGPCRQAAPVLEELVNNDSDLVLRKVDVVKWGTPVCQQFGINGIPFIQVYDGRGNKVGELKGFGKAALEGLINRARQ